MSTATGRRTWCCRSATSSRSSARWARSRICSSASTTGSTRTTPMDPEHVPTLLLNYGTLIDRSVTERFAGATTDDYDYLARGPLAPACVYPLRCVVGPRPVVRAYDVNTGADALRRFRVQYRGGRYDRRGRGFLGFQAKITTELDTASGTLDLYGDPLASRPRSGHDLSRQQGSSAKRSAGRSILARRTLRGSSCRSPRWKRELRPTNGGATYFLMPVEVSQVRAQGQFNPAGRSVAPRVASALREGELVVRGRARRWSPPTTTTTATSSGR